MGAISCETTERLLDQGGLWARTTSGRYWRLRRNGKTQRWVRDSFRFRIPVKAGFRSYGEITKDTFVGTFDSKADIICSSVDPNTCPHRTALALQGLLVD